MQENCDAGREAGTYPAKSTPCHNWMPKGWVLGFPVRSSTSPRGRVFFSFFPSSPSPAWRNCGIGFNPENLGRSVTYRCSWLVLFTEYALYRWIFCAFA